MKKILLFIATAILLVMSVSPGLGQLDPNILWVSDSTLGFFDGFAIHPNGNVLAYHNGFSDFGQIMDTLKVVELDGKTGKFIRKFPVFSSENNISVIKVSSDGKYIITSYDEVNIVNYETTELIKRIPKMGAVSIFPDNNKILGTNLRYNASLDSGIIVYDIQLDKKIYIKSENGVGVTSISQDGNYFATGGLKSNYVNGSKIFYTILTLWNAVTLTPISTLGQYEGSNPVNSIKFSPDGKYVGFQVYYDNVYIYNTTDFTLFKHYNSNTTNNGFFVFFCFINNDYLSAKAEKTLIFNLKDDKVIYQYNTHGGAYVDVNYDKKNNFLFSLGSQITAFDLNKILSTTAENIEKNSLSINYENGIINISGINLLSSSTIIILFDINGKIIRQLNIPYSNGAVKIPMKLMNGTYILNIKDGDKEYSSKFLVTE
jgi:WD40 repeat protein